MKRWMIFAIAVAVLFLVAFLVHRAGAGEQRTLHVEWDYPADLPGVAGFRVYLGDTMVQEFADPTARAGDMTVVLEPGENIFTMTAFDVTGLESAHSDPYSVGMLHGPVITHVAPAIGQ